MNHISVTNKTIIHAEILQKRKSHHKECDLSPIATTWIHSYANLQLIYKQLQDSNEYVIIDKFPSEISSHIESICLTTSSLSSLSDDETHSDCDINGVNDMIVQSNDIELKCHFYKLNYESIGDDEMEDDDGQMPSANHTFLPSSALHGLWESLIYDDNIKDQLLNFALTSLIFADNKVNSQIITWNKVVLLHGPPGTGKTSLCRALAQKLSIRMRDRYKCSQLIEINSHSLFSKWFSESGKLVMKLFQKIREYVESGDQLVFVLIDEVESLAHMRQVSMNGTEPSDAIRVVNALLTQIDNIKNYPNVVILTTSNITEAIDLAFVDRADIKQYIALPSVEAIYEIYRSCVQELVKANIVSLGPSVLLNHYQLKNASIFKDDAFAESNQLLDISKKSVNLSGRTLRKIPFLAIALYSNGHIPIKLRNFLNYLLKSVEKQFKDRDDLNSK